VLVEAPFFIVDIVHNLGFRHIYFM